MNWRKPLIFGLLHVTGSKIPQYLKEIEELQYKPQDEIKKYQEEKLKKLLLYAYKNVPYYHRILPEAGAIKNEEVHLENFDGIPILTKEIIRKEGENLYSKDYKSRKPYENTSGGSTGEPVKFIQDKEYDEWNTATKIYYNWMLGKDIGEKEIKFWGSERDIIEGDIGFKNKVLNYIYNRSFINSFKLDSSKLNKAVNKWNEFKPKVVWSYVDSAYELAAYIEKNKIEIYSPDGIIVTAGVLTEKVRRYIERIFQTKVYNQYGSREEGVIACECKSQEGLHVFEFSQYLELKNPDKSGNGEIIITNLTNFSMPLIRYKMEDTAKIKNEKCSCSRGFRLLEDITGRITDHFIREDGTIIHGEYFTHLFYFRDWVKKFKVVQKDYDLVICSIVLAKDKSQRDMGDIENKIKLVMGNDCKVEFEFVDEIEPTKSGKYLYTVSEVRK